jgi:hypothetical protein
MKYKVCNLCPPHAQKLLPMRTRKCPRCGEFPAFSAPTFDQVEEHNEWVIRRNRLLVELACEPVHSDREG